MDNPAYKVLPGGPGKLRIKSCRNFAVFRKLLEYIGIEPERFHMSWVSAAEGDKWAEVVKDVVKVVESAGPNTHFSKKKEDNG